ncbi:metal dependent phosphohydrolase, partial [mine drainage metagenome]
RELSSPELLSQVSHEEVTRQRVASDPELRELLSSRPEFRGISAREVADLAVGVGKDPTLNALVHGEIDADRIDYIVRDNHHCGFPSGVDVHLLPSLFWRDPHGGLVLNRDRAYFAEQLLLARHHLQVRIHDEPRNRVADLLLARALRAYFLHANPEARERFVATVRKGGTANSSPCSARASPRRSGISITTSREPLPGSPWPSFPSTGSPPRPGMP